MRREKKTKNNEMRFVAATPKNVIPIYLLNNIIN